MSQSHPWEVPPLASRSMIEPKQLSRRTAWNRCESANYSNICLTSTSSTIVLPLPLSHSNHPCRCCCVREGGRICSKPRSTNKCCVLSPYMAIVECKPEGSRKSLCIINEVLHACSGHQHGDLRKGAMRLNHCVTANTAFHEGSTVYISCQMRVEALYFLRATKT